MNGNVYIISEAARADENDYGIVLHQKFINDVGWGNARSLAILDDLAAKDTRMLHSYWPLVNGLPLNIPKAMYAYSFDVYGLDPLPPFEAHDFSVRAGIPDELTWMGQNYAELRIIPPTTGGFTYAPTEQINLEWKVYPDTFTALKTPHNIYFGVWKSPTVDGRSATVHEVGSSGRILLYEGTRNRWANFSPNYFAWKNVVFPLQGSVSSGTLHFTVPRGAQGEWAFVIAIIDPTTGQFIAFPEIACSQYFWVE
jgi:hypothetical protein